MTREKLRIVKNAIANVARGGAAAIVAVVLPPFLTRAMSPQNYGAWALVLQISAYIGYLDFGIQTAIGRFIAHAGETQDNAHQRRVLTTAFLLLLGAAFLALVFLVIAITLAPWLFHSVSANLGTEMKIALALVGGSLAIGLPASAFNGLFIGLHRNEIPAAIIGVSRLISAALLILVVKHDGTLWQMGASVAVVNLISYATQYVTYRIITPEISLSWRLVTKEAIRELTGYCASLMVWSFATLLVAGADLILVGLFDFRNVAYYAVAAGLVSFIVGLQYSIFNAMISPAAALHARGEFEKLGAVVVTATRYGMFLLLISGLPLIFGANFILTKWVGSAYSAKTVPLLQILVLANIIRMSAAPYAMALIASGQQKLVIVCPLLEGFSNLFASIIAGYLFGALGIAIGTLFGSVVGVGGNFLYNMRQTTEAR